MRLSSRNFCYQHCGELCSEPIRVTATKIWIPVALIGAKKFVRAIFDSPPLKKSYRGSKMLTKSSQIPIGSTIGNHRLPEPILRGFFDISRLSRPHHRPHMFSRPEIEWETLLDNSRSDRSNLKRPNPRPKVQNRPKSDLVPTSFSKYYPTTLVDTVKQNYNKTRG